MSDPTRVALVERLREKIALGAVKFDVSEVRPLLDALSRPVAVPPLEPTDEWLGKHLQPRGVCDRGCMCEDDLELRRDVFDGLREALAVAAPPEGTLTREQAETRLTDEDLADAVQARDVAEDAFHRLQRGAVYDEQRSNALRAAGWAGARAVILAALFPHDGSRT